jgi:hypothetical protein
MDDDTTTTGTGTPAGEGTDALLASKLGNLKARRQEVVEKQLLERRVPRWTDPYIWVQYKPIPHSLIRSGFTRIDAAPPSKKAQVELEANMDLLIRGCVAVYATLEPDEDADRYSLRNGDPFGPPTTFDPDLAENLGLGEGVSSARAVVKELFIVDGDVLAHGRALSEFSGYRDKEADDEALGE